MIEEDIISVIVPVYNGERYLAACLDSIITQSYKLLEIIVINDGSSDFGLEIAQKYSEKDDRIKVYTYENGGLSVARNRGLSLATGDYITFVDADDLLLPRALETMYRILKKHGGDIIQGETIRAKVHKEIQLPKKFPYLEFKPEEAISNVLYQKKLLPSVCAKLYKRDLFKDINFEKGLLYEDLNIFYLLFERANKIIWIDFPVYFYRDTDGSIINTWTPKRLDVLKVTENIENYMLTHYPGIIGGARDRRLSANFNMFALCSLNGEKEKASECWKLIKNYRMKALWDSQVRNKNKVGILLSFLGPNIFANLSKFIYK